MGAADRIIHASDRFLYCNPIPSHIDPHIKYVKDGPAFYVAVVLVILTALACQTGEVHGADPEGAISSAQPCFPGEYRKDHMERDFPFVMNWSLANFINTILVVAANPVWQ